MIAPQPPGRVESVLGLDLLRGLAALAVFLGHVRGGFFIRFSELSDPSPLQWVLYAATALGHQAVMIFFVLSGYLIASTVRRALADDRWSWGDYLLRRLTRLYIVLIPALVLGAVWDYFTISVTSPDTVYARPGRAPVLLHAYLVERLGVDTFLGNLLFLQDIAFTPFGSNGALWSLSFEFWYYLLFPALALVVSARTSPRLKMFYLLVVIAIATVVGERVLSYFAIWFMGALVALVPPVTWRRSASFHAPAIAAGVIFAALVATALLSNGLEEDLLVGVAAATSVFLLVNSPPMAQRAPSAWAVRLARAFAARSYTLYVVHLPVLMWMQSLTMRSGGSRWHPDGAHLALAAVIVLLILGYTWAIAFATEMRTEVVRQWLTSGLRNAAQRGVLPAGAARTRAKAAIQ